MNAHARTFEAKPATRDGSGFPLLVGIFGASGAGKTYSALRLATGIQQVVGGDIFGIDTEARRMLAYADYFKFKHVQFDAPFGSLDYLAAARQSVAAGARTIVIDSMTHEHTGPEGYLETHEKELDRMAGNDWAKRDKVNFTARIKPAKNRRDMIDGLLQLNANFILCFRAKEKIKPMPGRQPMQLGFMPVGSDELMFEMTTACLLLPRSNGIPTWNPEFPGEKQMVKPARQFDDIFKESKPIDEQIGRQLAEWARGGTTETKPRAPEKPTSDVPYQQRAETMMNNENATAAQLKSWWKDTAAERETMDADEREQLRVRFQTAIQNAA